MFELSGQFYGHWVIEPYVVVLSDYRKNLEEKGIFISIQ